MPKDTSKPESQPYPCRCGCGRLVNRDITIRTEYNHRQRQAAAQTELEPELELSDEDAFDLPDSTTNEPGGSPGGQGGQPASPPPNINSPGSPMVVSPQRAEPTSDSWEEHMDEDHVRLVKEALQPWAQAQDSDQVRERRTWVEEVEDEDDVASQGRAANTGGLDGLFDYDREDEYNLNMGPLTDELEEEMERMIAEFSAELSEQDIDWLRAFNLKLVDNLSDTTFGHLAHAFPKHNIASLKVTRKRIEFLSQFRPQPYDCCINSCMCYAGPYAKDKKCRYCPELRYNPSGKPRKQFNYIPLAPRLAALFKNIDMVEKMFYRHNYHHEDGVLQDIFDGQIYATLRQTKVKVGDTEQDYRYFEEATDIALGFASDGFAPFKSRKTTCWPILVYNYNLPPDIRFHFEHLICVGVIPGPHKPKDFDSFLWPFVCELLELALGVKAWHGVEERFFTLRAYPLLGGGDMPAVAMMMQMKGHSSIFACRMCKIRGVLKPGSTTYYAPLNYPDSIAAPPGFPSSYDPSDLPLRTHEEFLEDGRRCDAASTAAAADRHARDSGVKGVPLLAQVPSLFFPASFPFDFMHLIYENLIKNLINFWCGDFKDLDHDGEGYYLDKTVWDGIGEATAASGRTTPLAYGPAVPNFTLEGVRMTADMYSFWFQYLGPVLLAKVFKNKGVYKHFVELVRLINLCLKFSITEGEVEEIQEGFISWVEEYERIYYKEDADRLSACPITVHALLHIAEGILMMGPVWVYWAFPMERFCGRLGRVIRSRRFPFSNLDNQVLAHAQLSMLKNMYPKLRQELSLTGGTKKMTMWEYQIPTQFDPNKLYEKYALVAPRQIDPYVPPAVRTKLAAALVTRFSPLNAKKEDLIPIERTKELLNSSTIEAWGRLRRLECGDTMLASEIVHREAEDRRDATFVRYDTLVDENARKKHGKTKLVKKTSYGQLNYVYLIKIPPAADINITTTTYVVFAVIAQCDKPVQHQSGLDIHVYTKLRASEVVDITTVQALVGRIWWNNQWAIFDRSGDLARAVFDEGNTSDVD